MPSAAFTAWLADTATDRIVLCDLQMAEQTSGDGWTVHGVYTNSYTLSWSNFIGTGGDAVYRRIDKVRENATDYTERASAALVDANASSWYYDEANTTIYVRTSTGSDPDTFSSIAVYFSLFFGTTAKAFDGGQLYEPMLVGELPVLDLQAEDILFGIKMLEEGNVDIQNAHAFWDTASQDYIWKNKLATFYIGGGSLDFSDYERVGVMRIEDAAVGDDICRFRLNHMSTILDKILPINTFTKASYPSAGEGVYGTYIPIVYGKKNDCPGICTDITVGQAGDTGETYWETEYILNDPAAFALTNITNVRMVDSSGVQHGLTEDLDYTTSLADCKVTVKPTVLQGSGVSPTEYDPQNHTLIADLEGKSVNYPATDVNGSTDYYSRSSDLTGNADGQKGTVYLVVRLDGGDATVMTIISCGDGLGGYYFFVRRKADNKITVVCKDSGAATILSMDSTSTYTSGETLHILASWNLTTPVTTQLYINDSDDKGTTSTTADTDIDYTQPDWAIGCRTAPDQYLNGAIQVAFAEFTNYTDFSSKANRRKFHDENLKPAHLGRDGSKPTGTQPTIYCYGNADDFATNHGSGGDFTKNGSPTTDYDVASATVLNKWGQISEDIIELLGEDTSNIDISSFSTADDDGYQSIGLHMRDPKPSKEYIMQLERSVRGYIYMDREGQWSATVHLPYAMKGETADSIVDEDYVSWEPEDKIETVYHSVVVKYDQNPHKGEWKEKSASDSQVEYELERSDTARIETCLVNGSQAGRQAERWLTTLTQPSIQVAMHMRGLGALLKHPFERYIVTRNRAPDSAGAWTDEQCELIEVQKTLAPPGVYLKIRKLNQGTKGTRIRYWATSGILDYDSEDSADQEAYAFWHDSNGELGVGNVETHSSWY